MALARAIVCRPKVLLLAGPQSAGDGQLRKALQIEWKRLQKKLGITLVFVTHDQEEALTISDRIALVNGGRIEQIGTTTEIYHAPATAFVARFIGMANILKGRFWGRKRGCSGWEWAAGWRGERRGGRIGVGTGNDRTPFVQSRCIGKASGILARASLRKRWWGAF